MTVSSTTGIPCLRAFLGGFFAALFRGRFFGVARFDVFLCAGLALAFPRFEAFLRVARRFLALAMAVLCEVCPSEPISKLPTLSVSNSPRHFYRLLLWGHWRHFAHGKTVRLTGGADVITAPQENP
jgi:hypothetical protein